MIIDMTKDVVQAILKIPEVVAWTAKANGMPNISANKLPAAQYPAIMIEEYDNNPEKFADDEEYSSTIKFQIMLLSKDGSHGKIQNEINKIMYELGFTREASPTLFDEENNITQKVLRYAQEIEKEGI